MSDFPTHLPVSAAGRSAVPHIGQMLVEAGKLAESDLGLISQEQALAGVRFGEAAVRLGLVNAADVRHALARQFDFAWLSIGDSGIGTELVAAYEPFDPRAEALRNLRCQVMLSLPDECKRARVVAVASPDRYEGRSFLAGNLAVVFSQLGERTLLVDADMRNPRQHQLFGVGNRTGLSSLLAGRHGDDVLVSVAALPQLWMLPAGPVPPNPQELLGRRFFRNVLAELAAEFDAIIVDTPALACGADAQMVAASAGVSLVVARQDFTTFRALNGLKEAFTRAGTRIIGTTLSRF